MNPYRRETTDPDTQKPDVEGARRLLAETRRKRVAIDEIVAALASEERLNNFQANLLYVFRGART